MEECIITGHKSKASGPLNAKLKLVLSFAVARRTHDSASRKIPIDSLRKRKRERESFDLNREPFGNFFKNNYHSVR